MNILLSVSTSLSTNIDYINKIKKSSGVNQNETLLLSTKLIDEEEIKKYDKVLLIWDGLDRIQSENLKLAIKNNIEVYTNI